MKAKRTATRWRPVFQGGLILPWLRDLEGRNGCYLLRLPGGPVEYVGRSTTGRLRKTLMRHFYGWKGDTAGHTVTKRHEARAIMTTKDDAAELERELIRRHSPDGNKRGQEVIPF